MIKKILIVDDSPVSIKIMKSCVPKEPGYELFDACNGKDGVDKYLLNRPDLTFMDLTMPVMNGFEALSEIMKHNEKALVIIVTADVQVRAIAKAHELGAFTVVKKPPTKETIAAAIAEAQQELAKRN